MIQVFPITDIIIHNTNPDNTMCQCNPRLEYENGSGIVIHHALNEDYSGKWCCQGEEYEPLYDE